MELPRGVGLVRVNLPRHPIIWVSPRLTGREAVVARAIAYALSERGERIIVLKETMIMLAVAA